MLEGLVISTGNYGLDAFCGRVEPVKLEVSRILCLIFECSRAKKSLCTKWGNERFVEMIIGGKFKITN